jgi:hypothetical protein
VIFLYRAAFIDSDLCYRGALYILISYVEVPLIESDLLYNCIYIKFAVTLSDQLNPDLNHMKCLKMPSVYVSILSSNMMVQVLRTANTVKPVYKGHSREPENVPIMSSCYL